jgi:hypothetical protein
MGPYVTAALVHDRRARLLRQAHARRTGRLVGHAPVSDQATPPPQWPVEHTTVVRPMSSTRLPAVDEEPAA